MQPNEIASNAVNHWEAIQGTLPINAALDARHNSDLVDLVVYVHTPFQEPWTQAISVDCSTTRATINQDVELLHRLASQHIIGRR